MANATLYPPIVGSWVSSFEYNTNVNIPIDLSGYNSLSEINGVQLSISYQDTNTSAIDINEWDAQIVVLQDLSDITNIIKTDANGKYYITVNKTYLKSDIWQIDRYYKLQIRFMDAETPDFEERTGSDTAWITNNIEHFSEWSSVCILKAIPTSSMTWIGITSTITYVPSSFVGILNFSSDTIERLKNGKITISQTNNIIYQSKIINADEEVLNKITIPINVYLANGTYTFTYTYQTSNGFERTQNFSLTLAVPAQSAPQGDMIGEEQPGNAGIAVSYFTSDADTFEEGDTIYLVRNILDSGAVYETIDQLLLTEETAAQAKHTWLDLSAESGVPYIYGLQVHKADAVEGSRSPISPNVTDTIVLYLDDIFLLDETRLFDVKFNPQVSNFKEVFAESKSESLGSKFPFIRRNGDVDYLQFSLSGLIASDCDEFDLNKTGLTSIYKHTAGETINMTSYAKPDTPAQYANERLYREAIMKFLNNGKIKLFKSITEGNILVRLSDVSFTPNQQLGRRFYTFNATASQVADFSIDELKVNRIPYVKKVV